MEKYEFEKKLGSGAYGQVFRARNTITGQMVAIKKVDADTQDDRDNAEDEVEAMKMVNHPNVLKVIEVHQCNEGQKMYLCIVLELMDMSLSDLMEKKYLGPRARASLTLDMLSGLAALHAKHIIHCDIKPQNLLISADMRLKIGDLGIADVARGGLEVDRPCQTMPYRAPEILTRIGRFSLIADMWSAGVVMAEMFNGGGTLFYGYERLEVLYEILRALGTPTDATWPGISKAPFYDSWPEWPPVGVDYLINCAPTDPLLPVMRGLLVMNPAARLTAANAQAMVRRIVNSSSQ